VNVMVPRGPHAAAQVDVTAAMEERPHNRGLRLPVIDTSDPFAAVEV